MASSENRGGRSRERDSSRQKHTGGGDYRRGGGSDHREKDRTEAAAGAKDTDNHREERPDRPRDRSPVNRNFPDRNAPPSNKSGHTFEEALEISKKKVASRCRLFVGNLSNEMKEADLRELFEPFGEITECFMSGKGFGFVRLDTRARAETAKENLDGRLVKGRSIRVRYAVHGASVKIKELNPCVSNELLAQAFSIFGEVERAVHILDEKSQPTGEGVVEFERKPGAVDALRRINEGVFLMTHNPKPIIVEPLEPRDDEDGLTEKMINKGGMYQKERSQPPRFAVPGSFEFEFGNRWKELYQLERMKRDHLDREFRDAREKLENEMEIAFQEYQTAQLREDLRRRQEELERLESARRERMEMLRLREEERNRSRQELHQQQQQQHQQQQQQNFRNFGAPPPFNMPPMSQNPGLPTSAAQRMHDMRPNEFNTPPRSDEQLVHGVQKLMQMMQHSNQNRAAFPPTGVPPPQTSESQQQAMRPNLLNFPHFPEGEGDRAAIWKNNPPPQAGGRNFFR